MDANLVRRFAVAAVGVPIALGLAYWGGWPLVALLALVGPLGVREIFAFAERQGVRPSTLFGYATAASMAPAVYAAYAFPEWREFVAGAWPYVAALWLIALLTWALVVRKPSDRPQIGRASCRERV